MIGNDPLVAPELPGLAQILLKPLVEPRIVLQPQPIRIHGNKVDGAVIERVVGLVVGGHPTRLAVPRVGEEVKVGSGLAPQVGGRPVVVARGGEDRNSGVLLPEVIEELVLILFVPPGGVGEVPQSQGEVPVAAGEVDKGVPHAPGLVVAHPAVADGPDPDGVLGKGPALGKGGEGVVLRGGENVGPRLVPRGSGF